MSLIYYGTILGKGTDPIAVFELNKEKTTVTITGPEDFTKSYERYFSNTKSGWGYHLEEDSPLDSFAANWSYGRNESVSDQEKITKAKKFIIKNGGTEVTVSWEKSS